MSALSPTARHEYYLELARSLPLTQTREDHARRTATAIEAFNALNPADAHEGRLAVQVVLNGAHAADCLRDAGQYQGDLVKVMRCRAQATSMTRAAHAARRMLAQEQKLRLAVAAVAARTPGQPAAATRPAEPPAAPRQPIQAEAAPPLPTPVAQPLPPRPPVGQASAPQAKSAAPALRAASESRATPDPLLAAAGPRNDRGAAPSFKASLHAAAFPTHPEVADTLLRGASAGRTAAAKPARTSMDTAA